MKQRIMDEFSDLPISKQRRWQLRQEKAGKCITCGKPAARYQRCESHADALVLRTREHQRIRLGGERLNSPAPSDSFVLNG